MYDLHAQELKSHVTADAAINMTVLKILATVVCLIFLALLFENHIQANSNGKEESDEATGEANSS